MALPTASDNPFASLLVTENTAPASPASGKQRLFIDSADHTLKYKNSGGTVTKVGAGYEFDYVESTGTGTISATTEATANTIVTANAVTYDGSTIVLIEFFCPQIYSSTTVNEDLYIALFDGSTCIGTWGDIRTETTSRTLWFGTLQKRITPSAAAHTYSVRAYVPSAHNGGWSAGAGGTGTTLYPLFIRQTKVG